MEKYNYCLLTLYIGFFLNTAYADREFINELMPFTSDGCSSFFDGIPFVNEHKWQLCCVKHDISYWQGGTSEQRQEADEQLQQCVLESGEEAISHLMYLGVRAGGYAGLPTTWRWGYGWKIYRGYNPLSIHEGEQVKIISKEIPEGLSEIEIISSSVILTRESVTGDYCLDISVQYISDFLNSPFEILTIKDSVKESSMGWEKELTIQTLEYEKPFIFRFLLLRPKSCHIKMSEILARGRIRLQKIEIP